MRLLAALCLFIILWGITGHTKEARTCSSSFKKHRVFKAHTADRKATLTETLNLACATGLSDSQIAGRVLKSCIKSCDSRPEKEFDVVESLLLEENEKPKPTAVNTGAQCKKSCFNTLQKMAKETQRLKRVKTATR